jgi:hypothetical protein
MKFTKKIAYKNTEEKLFPYLTLFKNLNEISLKDSEVFVRDANYRFPLSLEKL